MLDQPKVKKITYPQRPLFIFIQLTFFNLYDQSYADNDNSEILKAFRFQTVILKEFRWGKIDEFCFTKCI